MTHVGPSEGAPDGPLDPTPTLEYWLERHRAGYAAARDELIRHSRERLRLLTQRMLRRFPGVRQWEQTSDVLQNVLVRINRALSAVPMESARDFLRQAAAQVRRELIDLSRHYFGPNGRGTHEAPPGANPEEALARLTSDREETPHQLALWAEFHGHIAKLPGDDLELFELLYYQGLSQPAAAELLGVPLTTLKRRWQSARLRLADELGGQLPE